MRPAAPLQGGQIIFVSVCYACRIVSEYGVSLNYGCPSRGYIGLGFLLKVRGTIFEGPRNKDYTTLGSILGSPFLGNCRIYSSGEVARYVGLICGVPHCYPIS